MTDLAKLIERVSAASGPDREIDRALLELATGFPVTWGRPEIFEPETVVTVEQYGAGAVGNPTYTLDPFTSSIDAALALTELLLPDHYGFGWHKASYMPSVGPKNDGKRICAEVWHVETPYAKISSGYRDTGPALAVILATLRALQARTPVEPES